MSSLICPFLPALRLGKTYLEPKLKAFNNLKQILNSNLVVTPYDLQKEVTFTCNASDAAISRILSQNGQPVMYFSRVLTLAETKYSIIKYSLFLVWYFLKIHGHFFSLVSMLVVDGEE